MKGYALPTFNPLQKKQSSTAKFYTISGTINPTAIVKPMNIIKPIPQFQKTNSKQIFGAKFDFLNRYYTEIYK